MGNALFLYDNLLDSAVLTASSEATGFPAENLKNPFRSKAWRTAGGVAGTADLVIDLSALWVTIGDNLVSNGEFSVNTNGWTPTDCTLASVGGGQAGNCLEITRTAEASQTASQVITCVSGRWHRMHFYVHDGALPGENFQVVIIGAGGLPLVSCSAASSATWDNYSYYYFTADQTNITIELTRLVNGAGTMLFDTIEVYEMTGAPINAIALTGYNWVSAPGTLDLEFNNADIWGAPPVTESLTWHPSPSMNGNKATIIKTFSEKYYLFARLNVVYAPGDWNIGRIFIGTSFEPETNYKMDWSGDIIDPSMINQTVGGQDHVDEIEKYRSFGFSFLVKTQAEWELFQKMVSNAGFSKDIFVAFDYANEPDEMTIYGKFMELPQMGNITGIYKRANFIFEESR